MKKVNETHVGRVSIARRPVDFDIRDKNSDPNTCYNMHLMIKDDSTGRTFVEVVMSGAEFLNAIASLAGRPCEYTLDKENLALIGKVRETMTCRIKERKIGAVVPKKYADAGWVHWSGYGNHHCWKTDGKHTYFECTLVRYVDKVEATPEVDSEFPDETTDLPWNEPVVKKPKGSVPVKSSAKAKGSVSVKAKGSR